MFKHEIHNYVVHKRFNRLYAKCSGAADDGYLNFYVNLMCVTYAQWQIKITKPVIIQQNAIEMMYS